MANDTAQVPAPAPAAKKPRKVFGLIYVERDRCKGCTFCVEFCPPKCLGMSEDFNAKGYHVPMLTAPDDCTGCNLCGLYCPDFAIYGWMRKAGKETP